MTDAVRTLLVERASPGDAEACATIFNRFVDATPWMPRVHDHADVERYYRDVMLAEREVGVARDGEEVVGFVAVEPATCFVAALYVADGYRRSGIGARLLEEARRSCPAGYRLWTFEANREAQRFYARHGLHELRRTEGDNEEGLPDILLEWRPTA